MLFAASPGQQSTSRAVKRTEPHEFKHDFADLQAHRLIPWQHVV
jgi:hypothetical protein